MTVAYAYTSTVKNNGVFYYRQSQACTAQFTRPSGIYAVETFEQPWQVFIIHTDSIVIDNEFIIFFCFFNRFDKNIPASGICYRIIYQLRNTASSRLEFPFIIMSGYRITLTLICFSGGKSATSSFIREIMLLIFVGTRSISRSPSPRCVIVAMSCNNSHRRITWL